MMNPIIGPGGATVRQGIVVLGVFVGMIGWLLMTFVSLILIQFATMISIISDPTISTTVSVFVVIYALVVDVVALGIQSISGTVVQAER